MRTGWQLVCRNPSAAPPPPPPGDITPAMIVDYVDTSGNFQQVTVASNGSTSITINQYSGVHFDATGTRSVVATNLYQAIANPGGAEIGYRINFGESLGTTWPISGSSTDEDTGPPVFGRVFTTTGTKTVRLRCKDTSGNEATLSMTVVVNALGSATNITAGTSWPTWASNTHYTLNRGSDYTSHGTITLNGLHNVFITATGSGADPIVSRWQTDSRNVVDAAVTRTRNCYIVGIDAAEVAWSGVGAVHFGVVNGRARKIIEAVQDFEYSQGTTDTVAKRDSIKIARGGFFWNSGETNQHSHSYALYAYKIRRFHFYGCTFNKTADTGGGSNVTRYGGEQVTTRYSLAVNTGTIIDAVFNTWRCTALTVDPVTNQPYPWDPTDDRVGRSDGSGTFGFPTIFCFWHKCQSGNASEVLTQAAWTMSAIPIGVLQSNEYCGFEDCTSYASPMQTSSDPNVDQSGLHLFLRGSRKALGTGAYFVQTISGASNSYYSSDYHNENANTRPVPTAF